MKIIIATDGSDFSREAIKQACEMVVNVENTEITVVSVYQTYIPLDAYSQSAEYTMEFETAMKTVAEKYANDAFLFIQDYFPDNKIDVTTLVKSGANDQVIIETAQDRNADLIVVGSHGRGFWGRVMVGSVTDSLVHNAPCSVLVVRKKVEITNN